MSTTARVIAGSVAGLMVISLGAAAFAPVAILAGAIMGPELKDALADMGIGTRTHHRYDHNDDPALPPPDNAHPNEPSLRNERYFQRQQRNR